MVTLNNTTALDNRIETVYKNKKYLQNAFPFWKEETEAEVLLFFIVSGRDPDEVRSESTSPLTVICTVISRMDSL